MTDMEVETARRKALQTAVAALCVESGFLNSERDAMGVLTEMMQSYITEVGRSARQYTELSGRTEPTLSDVHLALVDIGSKVSSIPDYAKRPQKRHLPRQGRSFPQPQSRSLQVGSKPQRPSHIPPHLPLFPDPHTYIKTPSFAPPVTDYRITREKLATQKRNSLKGLSRLLAKTRPSQPIAGAEDPSGLYTVISVAAPSEPLYLQALMSSPDDQTDTMATDKLTNQDSLDAKDSQPESSGAVPDADMEGDANAGADMELFENPFLKAPKRIKLRPL